VGSLPTPGSEVLDLLVLQSRLNLPQADALSSVVLLSLAADPRGGKADRNAPRRKSPQGQSHSHLPRSRDPRNHSTPMKLLTPRRHILETRVDRYILDALSSRPLSVAASALLTDKREAASRYLGEEGDR